MQQFVVPQFIDIEDKIIGPITTRQFLVMMVTTFSIFVSYAIADFSLFLFLAVIEASVGGVFAFLRINGRPFHDFMINILQTMKRPSLRVWGKHFDSRVTNIHEITVLKTKAEAAAEKQKEAEQRKSKQAKSLREITLMVDSGGVYNPEEEV